MILDTLTPTELGNNLIATALAQGGKITFTRCAVGSGLSGGSIESMTAIADEVGEYTIEAVTVSATSAIIVVKETEMPEAYYLREIGLFAKLGEGSEILFAAARETENPEYIQPGGSSVRDVSYTLQFTISNADNVVVKVASVLYIRESQKGVPGGIATLDNNGTIPKGQIPALSYIPVEEKGAEDGVAPLDDSKRIPREYMPERIKGSITATIGQYAKNSDGTYSVEIEIPCDISYVAVGIGSAAIHGVYEKTNKRILGQSTYSTVEDGVLYGTAGVLTEVHFDFTKLGYVSDIVTAEITAKGVRVTVSDEAKRRTVTVRYIEI